MEDPYFNISRPELSRKEKNLLLPCHAIIYWLHFIVFLDDEDWEANDEDEDEQIETVEDLITMAEEDECDYGAELFECYPDSDDEDVDESELNEEDYEPTRESLNKRVEKHNENVHIMRKSNFMLKAKIDRLYDILQMQKEKHHDLRQELTRMLADIQ